MLSPAILHMVGLATLMNWPSSSLSMTTLRTLTTPLILATTRTRRTICSLVAATQLMATTQSITVQIATHLRIIVSMATRPFIVATTRTQRTRRSMMITQGSMMEFTKSTIMKTRTKFTIQIATQLGLMTTMASTILGIKNILNNMATSRSQIPRRCTTQMATRFKPNTPIMATSRTQRTQRSMITTTRTQRTQRSLLATTRAQRT